MIQYTERTHFRLNFLVYQQPWIYLPWFHQKVIRSHDINTSKPRWNRRHFADAIFKWIFLNKNAWILIRISLKFVPQVLIDNKPALVQIMAWCLGSAKPLSEPMMVSLLMDICVIWPQWVKVVLVFDGRGFKLPVSSQYLAMIENTNIFYCFLESIQHVKGRYHGKYM